MLISVFAILYYNKCIYYYYRDHDIRDKSNAVSGNLNRDAEITNLPILLRIVYIAKLNDELVKIIYQRP